MTPEQAVIAREREAPPPTGPGKPRRPRRDLRALASDERLAKRAGRGDADAFAFIFRRYERDLYRFCLGILGEPQDAQDAIQNTMIRVLRALPGERRDIQLKPWLYRIAHNEAVELRRRERPAEELEAGLAAAEASVEDRAEQSERLQMLFRDMADLPERQRAALVMRELNGLDFGEIGAALRTSPGAVRQALYEARRGLQQMDLGRDMDCEAVARILSDEEGRLRGRDVRAHVRSCPDCSRFRREIGARKQTLAAISPLPVLALAAVLNGSLAGSGGAGGAGTVAAGAGAGAAGVGGGAAVSAVATSGLAKSLAGVLTVVAIGTAAADQGGLVAPLGGGPSAVEREAGPAAASPRGAAVGAAGRATIHRPGRASIDPARAVRTVAATSPVVSAQAPAPSVARSTRAGERAVAPAASVAASQSPAQGQSPAQREPLVVAAAPIAASIPTGGHGHAAAPDAAAKPEAGEGRGKAAGPADSGQREEGPDAAKGSRPENGQSAEAGVKPEKATKPEPGPKPGKAPKPEAAPKPETAPKPEHGPKPESSGGAGPMAQPESSPHTGLPAAPEHPPHPEHPEKDLPAPAAAPNPSETETAGAPAPAEPGNNGNGKGGGPKKEGLPSQP